MNLEQIAADYERDGVVRVRHVLSPGEVGEVRRELERYIRDVMPHVPPGDRTYEKDGIAIRNLWRMEQHDPFFLGLAGHAQIQALVREFLKSEPILVAVETFNKPALTGSAVPWHQDNAYFCQIPPAMLTVWIAIDPATVDNGAIYYIPGSQQSIAPHRPSGVRGNSIEVANPPQIALTDQFCGTLEPGDALIHHCQIMHRSEPNNTPYPRCGLLLVFRAPHTQEDPALKTAYLAAQSVLNN